jgi:YesN/AraC family two-component response regulator
MLNVLYVDDEPINLKIFELSFKDDFVVYRADSAIDALEIFKTETIDVVVSDLKMPVMNGVEFIREVKKLKPAMNCILLTAYYNPNMFLAPEIQSIIFKSVMKPFKKNEMKVIIQEAAV